MATYFEKPSNPEFSEQVERFETTETGHADTFNKRVKQLFHNELALRKAIEGVYQQASGYTDQAIADLIGGAPSTRNTLKEISDAMDEHQDVVEALDAAIGSKASEQEFEAHRVNSNIHVTADEKERLAKIYNTYQKKNAVDGINYNELYLVRYYILESDLMYLAGTLNLGNNINVSCKVSTYSADSDIKEEIICISWNSGESSVMCENGTGMSLGQIPVICMYKNGMYCFNLVEVLKQAATFAFSRMLFLNISGNCFIFSEKIAGAHGAVANLMKQIGTTPLGLGNGTLTEAIAELAESENNIRKKLSILYPESKSQIKKEFTSSTAATKEVIYEAKTDCFVSFCGFAQFLSPTENATVICNILIEQYLIQENTDGSQIPFTSSIPVTAITEKAITSGINLPFETRLKMRAGEVLKVQHAHIKGSGAIQMNLHYFLNVTS